VSPEPQTYRGRCHCSAVRFTLRSEPFRAALRCNCSMCTRKGALMSERYYGPDELIVEGTDALSVYHFGDRLVNHWFCRTCGIYPFHDVTTKPGHYRLNLGCVDGLDLLALEIRWVDGRSLPISD
jgi:hypothetical protein